MFGCQVHETKFHTINKFNYLMFSYRVQIHFIVFFKLQVNRHQCYYLFYINFPNSLYVFFKDHLITIDKYNSKKKIK